MFWSYQQDLTSISQWLMSWLGSPTHICEELDQKPGIRNPSAPWRIGWSTDGPIVFRPWATSIALVHQSVEVFQLWLMTNIIIVKMVLLSVSEGVHRQYYTRAWNCLWQPLSSGRNPYQLRGTPWPGDQPCIFGWRFGRPCTVCRVCPFICVIESHIP